MTTSQTYFNGKTPIADEIRRLLVALYDDDQVIELRGFRGSVVGSGYFDDREKLIAEAIKLDGQATLYVAVNRVDPSLIARHNNRYKESSFKDKVKTTTDDDVIARRWFALELDPVRPSDVPASNAQHARAHEVARECSDWFQIQGWSAPIYADSGNGAWLLFPLEEAEWQEKNRKDANLTLLKQVTAAVTEAFKEALDGDDIQNTIQIVIDPTVVNASRIGRLFGTLNKKGDGTPDRPHRRSVLIDVPPRLPTSRIIVEQTAKLHTSTQQAQTQSYSGHPFDVRTFLAQHAINVTQEKKNHYGTLLLLQECPFCGLGQSNITIMNNGALAFKCQHKRCDGNKWTTLREKFEPGYSRRSSGGLGNPPTGQPAGAPAKGNTAQQLLALAKMCETFKTPAGELFVRAPVDGHLETFTLSERGNFRSWLVYAYYQQTGASPSGDALSQALEVIRANATFSAKAQRVFTRVAFVNDKLYLDLANAQWQAIEIDAVGWRVINDPPVTFRRPKGILPLPEPTQGDLDLLRPFLNVRTEADWCMLIAWLVGTLLPTGAFAHLALFGEAGSAKSSTAKMLRRIIDPNEAPIRAQPKELQDLALAARNGRVVAYDNLSNLPGWLSDGLCRLSTGDAYSTRALFTDDEESLLVGQAPAIFNGITEIATAGDLNDRLISIALEPPVERKPENALWKAFDQAHPAILGGLLDVISVALSRYERLQCDDLPRLADFALWIEAAAPALGWEAGYFIDAMHALRLSARDVEIESSEVAMTLLKLFASTAGWRGTATELLNRLNDPLLGDHRTDKKWPQSPNGLTGTIKRVAPALRAKGLDVQVRKSNGSRFITIDTCSPESQGQTGTITGTIFVDRDAEKSGIVPVIVPDHSASVSGAVAKGAQGTQNRAIPLSEGEGKREEAEDLDPQDDTPQDKRDFASLPSLASLTSESQEKVSELSADDRLADAALESRLNSLFDGGALQKGKQECANLKSLELQAWWYAKFDAAGKGRSPLPVTKPIAPQHRRNVTVESHLATMEKRQAGTELAATELFDDDLARIAVEQDDANA